MNERKTKQGTGLSYMTKNYELCIFLVTLRLTIKFWLIIRNALLNHCKQWNEQNKIWPNRDNVPLMCLICVYIKKLSKATCWHHCVQNDIKLKMFSLLSKFTKYVREVFGNIKKNHGLKNCSQRFIHCVALLGNNLRK